jgi:hypothetical protein
LDYLRVNKKDPETVSFRDFVWAALEYAQTLKPEVPPLYLQHLSFLASKARCNVYTTEAILKYDKAIQERVDRGEGSFGPSDAHLATLHLGIDGTHKAAKEKSSQDRQKGRRMGDSQACLNFNMGKCTRKMCRFKHLSLLCKSKDHKATECKDKSEKSE